MGKKPQKDTAAIDLYWQNTLRVVTEGLVTVGTVYGDDADLMRAKAIRVCKLLRTITEQVPRRETRATLAPGLTAKQRRQVGSAIRKALDAGRDAALIHVATVLTSVLYELCTSVLAPERRQEP